MQSYYTRNFNKRFWRKNHTACNCGSFALDTLAWVSPYDNDEHYTEMFRHDLMQEMMDEGFDRQTIMESVLSLDQESILGACPWIEPVLPHEIRPNDRVIAYRLFINEEAFEEGELDDDYHFRVRINGFWFEKCGQDPIQFLGTNTDEEPWEVTPYLIYDSDICYFRFKEEEDKQ